jgi:hypothetical protein
MKDSLKLLISWGVYLRGRKPPAEKWAFLSRRLNFRVGGKNEEK